MHTALIKKIILGWDDFALMTDIADYFMSAPQTWGSKLGEAHFSNAIDKQV